MNPLENFQQVHDRVLRKWMKDLEEKIDPRVWSHCDLRVTSGGMRQEMWCDGTLRGVFLIEQHDQWRYTFVAKVVM